MIGSTVDDEKSDAALAEFRAQLRSLDFVPGRLLGVEGLKTLGSLPKVRRLDGIDGADFRNSLPNPALRPTFKITSSEPSNIDEAFFHYI